MQHTAFIGLGSNLEQPREQLRQAFLDLGALPHTRLLKSSSFYQSAPIGHADQPDFVNAVAQLSTELTPQQLMHSLLQIEHQHGRERTFRNAPRTLDLDLLLYDDLRMHEHGLTIPHPQMHLRAFVLQPLLEIVPDCAIPGLGSARDGLQHCQDQIVERLADEL
jgi:2-amino-4-hydroxy-6-hydroxymethyldihydropteridine diphosphokinase